MISTHTPLAGRDSFHIIAYARNGNFYSHASCGARRIEMILDNLTIAFLLTRLLRGATFTTVGHVFLFFISTHTPLAGRDARPRRGERFFFKISTHTPLAGRDFQMISRGLRPGISTHTPLAGRDVTRRCH